LCTVSARTLIVRVRSVLGEDMTLQPTTDLGGTRTRALPQPCCWERSNFAPTPMFRRSRRAGRTALRTGGKIGQKERNDSHPFDDTAKICNLSNLSDLSDGGAMVGRGGRREAPRSPVSVLYFQGSRPNSDHSPLHTLWHEPASPPRKGNQFAVSALHLLRADNFPHRCPPREAQTAHRQGLGSDPGRQATAPAKQIFN
jgi:hypothetical protein